MKKIRKIWIIGDLHLPFGQYKPMDIFGKNWVNYTEKIEKNWKEKISEEDIIFLAGDFSWAMKIEDSLPDFQFINNLPGKKILLKGNHDYWWNSVKKMKDFLEKNNIKNVDFLINNSFSIDGINFFGTKGWDTSSVNEDKNIRREVLRLNLSGETIKEEGINICIMHYPPFEKEKIKELNENKFENTFIDIIKKFNTKVCFYAHLHGDSHKTAFEGEKDGVLYKLVSGDYLNFNPVCITDLLIKNKIIK